MTTDVSYFVSDGGLDLHVETETSSRSWEICRMPMCRQMLCDSSRLVSHVDYHKYLTNVCFCLVHNQPPKLSTSLRWSWLF